MTLSDKIQAFLKSENNWVSREDIYKRGKKRGLGWEEVKKALEGLEGRLCIGRVFDFKTGQAMYRWYETTPEQEETWKNQQAFFDAL